MNTTTPQPDEELAPLDAFEQQWVDQLARRDTDLVRSEDAFVQAVMQRHTQASTGPAVLGRIGLAVLPYAVTAAVVLAGFVGWLVLTDDAALTPDDAPIAKQPTNSAPTDGLVATPNRPKVQLGLLIANAQASAIEPAARLTTSVNEVPDAIGVDRLFDLLGQSVPDLKEILAPLTPKYEQSRA